MANILKKRQKKEKLVIQSDKYYQFFFEMVISKIDSENVKNFSKDESLPGNKILSDTKYIYDSDFWGDFNIILPERKLSDEIERISLKIEESF